MNRARSILSGFVLSILAIGTGCSSSSDGTPPAAIPLETSEIRTYQQGDSLTADIALRDTATGNTASGTITITVGQIVPNPFGIDCRSITFAGTLTGTAGSVAYDVRSLFYQDSSNSVYECGEFDEALGRYVFLTDTATSPNGIFLEMKSPMQVGDSTSGLYFFDDGTWEDCTSTVQAIENVSVPLGFYESYKIFESCSDSDGTTLAITSWIVPSIYFLKQSGLADGISAEITINGYNL